MLTWAKHVAKPKGIVSAACQRFAQLGLTRNQTQCRGIGKVARPMPTWVVVQPGLREMSLTIR
jgi:hypothetical protein